MNPEFRRNIWLELSPRRVVFMTVMLALIFFAAAITGGNDYRPAAVAEFLYYFIVVFWGSRNAALSVVGEIRDRTWDSQRLSSLDAGTMTWGKLFGSTIYNWLGGGICLAVLLASRLVHQGPLAAFVDLVYFVVIGIISQAASLLASLIAARRRQTHTRLEVFAYQVTGILAAISVLFVWEAADPAGSFLIGKRPTEYIVWWGQSFDARPFLLVSLALYAGWVLVGCYRQMRLELKMRNSPSVWLGFLLFMGVYAAGFDAWFPKAPDIAAWDVVAFRLALAVFTYGGLTYAMVLLEPKDHVFYRWIGGEIIAGHIGRALASLQAWMMSYIAVVVMVATLVARLVQLEARFGQDSAVIVAALGFLTRDAAVFVLFQSLPGRRRGDFGAVIALFSLYVLIPAILDGLDVKGALPFFYPRPSDLLWLGPGAAWSEAVIAVALAVGRLAGGERTRGELAHA